MLNKQKSLLGAIFVFISISLDIFKITNMSFLLKVLLNIAIIFKNKGGELSDKNSFS